MGKACLLAWYFFKLFVLRGLTVTFAQHHIYCVSVKKILYDLILSRPQFSILETTDFTITS